MSLSLSVTDRDCNCNGITLYMHWICVCAYTSLLYIRQLPYVLVYRYSVCFSFQMCVSKWSCYSSTSTSWDASRKKKPPRDSWQKQAKFQKRKEHLKIFVFWLHLLHSLFGWHVFNEIATNSVNDHLTLFIFSLILWHGMFVFCIVLIDVHCSLTIWYISRVNFIWFVCTFFLWMWLVFMILIASTNYNRFE